MDNLFKTLLIIILLAFLYMYYENSNNDRYYYSAKYSRVLGKKTGIVYSKLLGGRFVSINYINGPVKNY